MLETFTLATFSPLVGTEFRVDVGGAVPVALRLAEASSLSGGRGVPAGYSREPFSLVFHGPVHPALSQRTYPFEHVALGRFEVFIVPIGPDAAGPRYEVIFA